MGCCIAEIAMFVFGIMTLVKGRFVLSRDRVVEGPPAYLIGAILVGTLPTIVLIAFVLGIMIALRTGRPPVAQDVQPYAGIEIVVSLVSIAAVVTIGYLSTNSKQKRKTSRPPVASPPYRPADPNNPYASPQADDRDRLLDELQ